MTPTYFGHPCGHPWGGALQRIYDINECEPTHKYQQNINNFLTDHHFHILPKKTLSAYIKNNYNTFSINVMLSVINTSSNIFHKLNPHPINSKDRNNMNTVVVDTYHTGSPFIYMRKYMMLLPIY